MKSRKYEKHLAYYELLEELRKSRRCSFCVLERTGIRKYFEGLLYEKVNDVGIRAALARSRGFCPRHAHILSSFGDALGTAILYADQLRLRLESLEVGPRRRSPARSEQGLCPACQAEIRMRQAHVRTLLHGLADPEMAAAWAGSAALCFPHFTLAMSEAKDPEVKSALVRTQGARLKGLASQVKQLIDRYDHLRAAEGFEEEKDSWLRAVEMISGLKTVF
ncbi:MAG TPA: DUF6062 family protein [Spirochaetia bacterium]|nr:DUF6062 family protein [Spirochaetia bacterium]